MAAPYDTLRQWIKESKRIVFFGGAGVSTASGIPDFRGAHGLYSGSQGKSYEEMLSILYFTEHPDEFWEFYRAVMLCPDAEPNGAHKALSRLESSGKLSALITQNIDGLHQRAGSRNVLELHGTHEHCSCVQCGRVYPLKAILSMNGTPRCECDGVIRPDIVFYGEGLDKAVLEEAVRKIGECDLLLVGGTSLIVQPAASLIGYRRHGARLCLLNHDVTPYDHYADLILRDSIADVLEAVID